MKEHLRLLAQFLIQQNADGSIARDLSETQGLRGVRTLVTTNALRCNNLLTAISYYGVGHRSQRG